MITIPGVDPKMIANNLEPAFPTHPGEILKEEIEYRGISQRKLAEQMGIGYSVLNEISKVFVSLGVVKKLWQRYIFVLTLLTKRSFFLKESMRILPRMLRFV